MLTSVMFTIDGTKATFHLDKAKTPAPVALIQSTLGTIVFQESCPSSWQGMSQSDITVKAAQYLGISNVESLTVYRRRSIKFTGDHLVSVTQLGIDQISSKYPLDTPETVTMLYGGKR